MALLSSAGKVCVLIGGLIIQQSRVGCQVTDSHSSSYWDRERPARNAPQARNLRLSAPFSRFALIAGETPAVPANHLIGYLMFQACPSNLSFRQFYSSRLQ